jgi:hypothetical protein
MCEYLHALQRPFPAEDIEWRVSHAVKGQNGSKALVLAYVTNRAIMERLDEVFGIAGWKNEYSEWRDKGVKCTLTCKVGDEWIAKEDGADVTDMEATKGGFSASMKRTAVQWGIGRYLYNLEQVWVPIKERGQNYIRTKTKQNEQIQGYWDTPLLPKWALPEGYEAKDPKPQEPADQYPDDLPEPPPEETQNNQPPQPTHVHQPEQPRQQSSGSGMARVFKLREEVGMEWKQLNTFASESLGRTIGFLKKDVTEAADWDKLEKDLIRYKETGEMPLPF